MSSCAVGETRPSLSLSLSLSVSLSLSYPPKRCAVLGNIGAYDMCGSSFGNANPNLYNRNIKKVE
eukprot:919723-Rhodomonas_salina.1